MEKNGISISVEDLLKTYRIITRIMKENEFTQDTSFRRVQTWLSNTICDNLSDSKILE